MDKDNKKIGRAIAVNFNLDGTVSMIVGGSFIEEKLEAAGLKADVDILVPGDVISEIDNMVHLNVSKESLSTTMDHALKDKEVLRVQRDMPVQRDVTKVQLFTQRPV